MRYFKAIFSLAGVLCFSTFALLAFAQDNIRTEPEETGSERAFRLAGVPEVKIRQGGKTVPTEPYRFYVQAPADGWKVTLRSAGKELAILQLARDEGTQVRFESDRMIRGAAKNRVTMSGKVTLRLSRGEQTVLQLTADEAVIETMAAEQ